MTVLRRSVLVVAVTSALMLAGGAAASADSERCTSGSGCAGRVTFTSYGEVFKVYDQLGDGHSAVALYWLPDGTGPHLIWNSGGNGTSVTANLEFPEGDWVTYRACLGEFGTKEILQDTCGATITDLA
jgi:hypothetical protein